MQQTCRCIGLSGACNAKCCYRTLKQLKVSTQWLKILYHNAVKVAFESRFKRDGSRLLVNAVTKDAPGKTDLIYLLDSPNYCLNDESTGSLGTRGRICNNTRESKGNCENLCCQRGYKTHLIMKIYNCKCKFHWCCEVECEECRKKFTEYRCK